MTKRLFLLLALFFANNTIAQESTASKQVSTFMIHNYKQQKKNMGLPSKGL
jgi:hypothetical protein